MFTIPNVVLSECDLLRPADDHVDDYKDNGDYDDDVDDDKDNSDENDGSQLVDSLKIRPAQREQK